MTVELTQRYGRAVELARQVHADDVRKGTTIPYLSHVLAVSSLVLEHHGTEDQAIAALLHDTAEDHGGVERINQIRAEFGEIVADIVEACSDSLVEDPNDKAPWWNRKIGYLTRLGTEPPDVALVSAADKLHNARAILADYRAIGDELWKRFNADAGRPGSLWYYTRLSEVLTERLSDSAAEPLAAEVVRTVDTIVNLAEQNGHDPHAEIAAGRATEAQVVAAHSASGDGSR